MRRRDFIKVIAGSATAWPFGVRAQQLVAPEVGFAYTGSPDADADLATAFRNGLSEVGYIDGQNVKVEYRWARNDNSKLPDMISDLIRRRMTVIAATGNAAALAAKAATATIPIVVNTGADPVEVGLVGSLARPDGNVTGITTMNSELGAKWLGLFHDLLPNAARFDVLIDPNSPFLDQFSRQVKAAVLAQGWQIESLDASTDAEIDTAFASVVQQRADALMIAPSPLFRQHLVKLATLASRHAIPAIYPIPQFAEAGGLMSYGTSYVDTFRQVGVYVGRILKGAKPAELPVLQPTKFEFVINLSTAKALGLTFPPGLLAIADRVIE